MPEIEHQYRGEAVFNFANTLKNAKNWSGVSAQDMAIYNALGKDLMECLFKTGSPNAWFEISGIYRQAWLDEIKRRIRGRELVLLTKQGINDETRFIMKNGALYGGSAMPTSLLFSQFKCNEHFQTNYGDSPGWIASKRIVEVVAALRTEPAKSIDFRISASYLGGKWIAWNNRGFATHCLANVIPMRIVPNPSPSEDEQFRLNEVIDVKTFKYSTSVPESRRTPSHWEPGAPCSVISIVNGANGTQVLYTIKNGFQRDNGNETVFNSVR
ncbi:hypothetical protein [Methylocaldum sp. GT1TLB]|uniref:hypothetical protein n=1 Tax=Methylocaldum sp. GT1TLB TaxID=3438965 RepID=UPI003DA01554